MLPGIKQRPMCNLWITEAPLGWTSLNWDGGLVWVTFPFRFPSFIYEMRSTIYSLHSFHRASDWRWRTWSPWTWWAGTSRRWTCCTPLWWIATSGSRWSGSRRTHWMRLSSLVTLILEGCLWLMALQGGGDCGGFKIDMVYCFRANRMESSQFAINGCSEKVPKFTHYGLWRTTPLQSLGMDLVGVLQIQDHIHCRACAVKLPKNKICPKMRYINLKTEQNARLYKVPNSAKCINVLQ